MISLTVNGQRHEIDADPATPLLYVLRGPLELNSARYGCGLGQCGACTVLLESQPVFSCLTPLGAIGTRAVRTLEGLGSSTQPGVLQRAFLEEQAAQCGYCIPGMMMRAQALLERSHSPSDEQIRQVLQPNLCRCGTHMRILRAVRRAAVRMAAAGAARGGASR